MSKKICLALGSGGSKGLAHVGVIKALCENGFEITQIAGTSAGSLIGGLYAANPDYKKLEEFAKSINYLQLFNVLIELPVRSGLLRGKKMEKYLDKICGRKRIEDLPIRYRAVCSDVVKGEQFVFSEGKLATAIRASCAIPAIFSPVKHEGRVLIDGGAVNPIPVSELKPGKDEKIIAVGLYSKIFPKSYQKITKASLPMIAYVSMQVMVTKLSEQKLDEADIKILPPVEDINTLNFVRAKHYIDIGYETTMKQMSEIEKLFR